MYKNRTAKRCDSVVQVWQNYCQWRSIVDVSFSGCIGPRVWELSAPAQNRSDVDSSLFVWWAEHAKKLEKVSGRFFSLNKYTNVASMRKTAGDGRNALNAQPTPGNVSAARWVRCPRERYLIQSLRPRVWLGIMTEDIDININIAIFLKYRIHIDRDRSKWDRNSTIN